MVAISYLSEIQNPAYKSALRFSGYFVINVHNLWMLPFIFFCIGYYSISFIGYNKPIETPSVIGCCLQDALTILSASHLTVVIKGEKEDANLQEGTVIDQSPQPQQKVKSQQSVFLVIAKKPPAIYAPSLAGLYYEDVQKKAKSLGIRLKTAYLESHYPSALCIAQIPMPDVQLEEKVMYVYISSGITPLRIMPNFKHRTVEEVKHFLAEHMLEIKFFSGEQPHDDDLINDQRPLPGSLINVSKKPTIYVSSLKFN